MTALTREVAKAQTWPASPARRGWLWETCHQIYRAIQEMNYACRRIAELQAPWSIDVQRRGR